MVRASEEDLEIINAERDASPERWANWHDREQAHPTQEVVQEEVENHLANVDTQRSASSVSSYETRPRRPSTNLRTTSTQVERDIFAYLDRHPTVVSRIEGHRLQHAQTVGSTRSRGKKELPDFGGGKPWPPPLPDQEEFVTEFSGHDDPAHPQNWSFKDKLVISGILVFSSFAATFASSIFSTSATQVEQQFGVGQEVGTLATSLFVLGYAAGPICWAPISELYGRRIPTIFAAFAFGIFQIAVAVAKDLQTIMVCYNSLCHLHFSTDITDRSAASGVVGQALLH